jgi:hypothetical protein
MKRWQPHTGTPDGVNHAVEFLKLCSRERLAWFVR